MGFSPLGGVSPLGGLGGCADALAIKAAVRRAKIAHRFIFQSMPNVGYARRSVPRMFVRGYGEAKTGSVATHCSLKRMQESAGGCDSKSNSKIVDKIFERDWIRSD
jgi:hypothetical protein